MKTVLLTLVLAFAANIFCGAQEIKAEKVWGGYKFTQDGEILKMRDLVSLTKVDPQAFKHMKRARTNSTFASIFSFAGGFLIGLPIGRAIAGKEANWGLAGIGAGLVGIAIPFTRGANKNAKLAADYYNSAEGFSANKPFQPQFSFVVNNRGAGLVLNF